MKGTYNVVRYFRDKGTRQTVAKGLTLAEARAHCSGLNSSSATAWTTSALRRTKRNGPWFDGYTAEA